MEKIQHSKADRRRLLSTHLSRNVDRFDEALDDALEATFPASDPPSGSIDQDRQALPATVDKWFRCGVVTSFGVRQGYQERYECERLRHDDLTYNGVRTARWN